MTWPSLTGRRADRQRRFHCYESMLAKVRAALADDHGDALTIMDNLAVAYGGRTVNTKRRSLYTKRSSLSFGRSLASITSARSWR